MFLVINPLFDEGKGIMNYKEQLKSCKYILSSLLHGIIASHTYGIPANWITFKSVPGKLHGGKTKFLDYYLSIGRNDVTDPIDLSSYNNVSNEFLSKLIERECKLEIDLEKLQESCPFKK